MALNREQKTATVEKIKGLLETSKLTVYARYQGTSVKALQELRAAAIKNDTRVLVVKNRLFTKALEATDALKSADTSGLNGQLLYAFNSRNEVAPAQDLAAFAKTNPQLEFAGAITNTGQLLSADEVKALAALPSKDQLRGQLVAVIGAPLSGFTRVLSANIGGLVNVLNARANSL